MTDPTCSLRISFSGAAAREFERFLRQELDQELLREVSIEPIYEAGSTLDVNIIELLIKFPPACARGLALVLLRYIQKCPEKFTKPIHFIVGRTTEILEVSPGRLGDQAYLNDLLQRIASMLELLVLASEL